jgi:hypothetical protein
MKKLPLAICWTLAFFPFLSADVPAPSKAQTKHTQNKSAEEDDAGIVTFVPPPGWHQADSNALPPHVKFMVVGKGSTAFPPSMNLSVEPFKKGLNAYLKIIKSINESQGYEWKDLGMIKTQAGTASLSQVDTKTEWGDLRLMHAVLHKNGHIYILTASALKNEFSKFYKEFFAAMQSLRVNKDIFEMIPTPQRKAFLKKSCEQLKNQWNTLVAQKQKESPNVPVETLKEEIFQGDLFQTGTWKPFKDMIAQKFSDLGPDWQAVMLQKTEDELFNFN